MITADPDPMEHIEHVVIAMMCEAMRRLVSSVRHVRWKSSWTRG